MKLCLRDCDHFSFGEVLLSFSDWIYNMNSVLLSFDRIGTDVIMRLKDIDPWCEGLWILSFDVAERSTVWFAVSYDNQANVMLV